MRRSSLTDRPASRQRIRQLLFGFQTQARVHRPFPHRPQVSLPASLSILNRHLHFSTHPFDSHALQVFPASSKLEDPRSLSHIGSGIVDFQPQSPSLL
jgi:hypothetical protein